MIRKTNIKSIRQRIFAIGAVFALVLALVPAPVFAGPITAKSVVIGSSIASASTTYDFTFTVPSATVLQSVEFEACTTASGACSAPAGFDASSAVLDSQPTNLGDATGWATTESTAGALRLNKTGNSAAPTGSQSVVFNTVTNPSATNATFYLRITTYTGDDYATGAVDAGNVATSTAGLVTVDALVDESLTFTLGDQNVDLGTLTNATTGSGTSTMVASTNAQGGYTIDVNGTTLTSGSDTITALAAQTASTQDTEQFGINLKANTTPSVGSEVSGSGSGAASASYGTADQFRFASGETVASTGSPTNSNTFTVSYIANIAGVTEPGAYQALLNYVMTANF